MQPRQLDLEIGSSIPIDVPLDDGFVVGDTGEVLLYVMQLAGLVVKGLLANEMKCLIARSLFGINGRKIDIVGEMHEIRDHVTVGAFRAVAFEVEN